MTSTQEPHLTVGFVVPSPALVTRAEFRSLLPASVDLAFSEVQVPIATIEANLSMLEDGLDTAVEQLRAASCDVIVYGGVSPSIAMGPGNEQIFSKRIATVGHTAALVAMEATLQALHALRARKITIVTPLDEEMTRKISDYFIESSFSVVAAVGQGLSASTDVHHTGETAARDLSHAAHRMAPDTDCVYIYGGGWPSLGVIEELRTALGVPILSSNIATAWVLHEMLRVRPTSTAVASFADYVVRAAAR